MFFLLYCIGEINAQYTPMFTHNYTTREGLPSNTVYHIAQDKAGYLWFATDGGVSRFDGRNFKNFNIQNGTKGTEAFGIQEADNKIWFYNFNGNWFYDIDKQQFSDSLENHKIDAILGKKTAIVINNEGLWAAENGFIKFASKDFTIAKSWKVATKDENRLYPLSNGDVLYFGNLVYKYDHVTQQTTLYDSLTLLLTSRHLLHNKGKNRTYYQTEKGIASYDFIEKKCRLHLSNAVFHNEGICGIDVLDGFLEKSILAINTTKNTYFWDIENQCVVLKTNIGKWSNEVFKDKEGNYWLCTDNDGVFFYDNIAIQHFSPKENNPLRQHFIFICQNQEGWIAAANQNQEVSIFDNQGKMLHQINTQVTNQDTDPIKKIYFEEKKLYVLTQSKLLIYPNLRKNTTSLVKNIGGKTFCLTRKKEVYIASKILCRLSAQFNAVKALNIDYTVTQNKNFYTITQDQQEVVWLGGVTGIFLYSPQNEEFKALNFDFKRVAVSDILVVDEERVLVATYGNGVFLFKNKEYVAHWNKQNFLSNDNVKRLFQYQNQIWFCSDTGFDLLEFDAADKSKFQFSKKTNLLRFTGTINDITIKNDKAFVATSTGIFAFNTNSLNPYTAAPNLYLHSNTSNQDTFQIIDNQSLTFFFQGIAFQNGEKLYYRHQLFKQNFWGTYFPETALDSSFQEGILGRFYTEGTYRLEVSCRRVGNSEVWSAPKQLHFQSIAPFYRSRGAKLAYFLLCSALFFGLYAKWVRHNQAKQLAVQQERLDLEHKALRSQMNPHFIFNSLGTAEKFFLNHETEEGLDYLADMASLMRQMLENSKHPFISMAAEIDFVKQYMDLEAIRHNYTFQFELIVEESVSDFSLMLPPMMLQPFLENAVKYGISTKHNNNFITLNINIAGCFLIATIDDNGQGINATKAKKTTQKHQSQAISIIGKRLALMSDGHKRRGSLSIIDKKEINPMQQGTLVTIKIPIQQ